MSRRRKRVLETKQEPLAPFRVFVRRQAAAIGLAGLVLLGGLCIGMAGHHLFAAMPSLDALLHPTMILTGMGPVDRLETSAGKTFAIAYALFSSLLLVLATSIAVVPLIHRILHAFHGDEAEG